MLTRQLVLTHTAALAIGVSIAAAPSVLAAHRTQNVNYPYLAYITASQISQKLGNPTLGFPPYSVSGRLDKLDRNQQYEFSKLLAICQAISARC